MNWQPIVTSRDQKHLVKGTELAMAIVPGTLSRFAIYEVRTLEKDGFSGVRYHVRDAETISDADIRNGKRPQIVFRSETFEECMEWCINQSGPSS